MILLFKSRPKKRSAFTLVELLVVLAIIALLSALLFPAFKRAQENGNQTTCQSNLHQIYLATQQYYQDERAYPDTLLDVMGEGIKYTYVVAGTPVPCTIGVQCEAAPTPVPTTTPVPAGQPIRDTGSGYFRGNNDSLICPDDDTQNSVGRSSYGPLTKSALAAITAPITADNPVDPGLYAWNYWGYRPDGFAYASPAEAKAGTPTASPLLVTQERANLATADPSDREPAPYNQSEILDPANPDNLLKNSLSYRFAPPSTIITHCVYHRLSTGDDVIAPGDVYDTARPSNPKNARDIILRLDGTVKAVEISTWKTDNKWRTQPLQ